MATLQIPPTLEEMAVAFDALEVATGYPPSVGLAQFGCESAWGKEPTGDRNYWGIKRRPEHGPAKFVPTTEVLSPAAFALLPADVRESCHKVERYNAVKNRYHLSDWFASYASLVESVHAYYQFLIVDNARYQPAWVAYQKDHNPVTFIRGIAAAGYATDPEYVAEIVAISLQANIAAAIQKARAARLAHGAAA